MSFTPEYPTDIALWPGASMAPHLLDLAESITELGLWPYLRDRDPAPFVFSSDPEVRRISLHPRNSMHSGASFAVCMRAMQFLAKNGFVALVEKNDSDSASKIKP